MIGSPSSQHSKASSKIHSDMSVASKSGKYWVVPSMPKHQSRHTYDVCLPASQSDLSQGEDFPVWAYMFVAIHKLCGHATRQLDDV